jgi:small-conductance mechanosensitive channel
MAMETRKQGQGRRIFESGAETRLGRACRVTSVVLAPGLCPLVSAAQSAEDAPDAAAPLAEELPITAARIEGLQTLASGEHPGVPLDTLLNVSLDDDSSMMERDRSVRLARRKVLIAARQAERFENKTPEELALMRDQILAMDLERKVLALPIEVRSRLVDLDAEVAEKRAAGGATDSPAAAVPAPNAASHKAEHAEPGISSRAAPRTASTPTVSEPTDSAPAATSTRFTGWLALAAILFGSFLTARLLGLAFGWIGRRIPERRGQLDQLANIGRFLIIGLGLTAAVTVPFPLSHEVSLVVLATLALTLAFALRDFAASVLAGLIVVLQRPFRVGDRVEFGGVHGKVTEIGLLSIRLLTSQHRMITIPNNSFLTKLVSSAPPSAAVTPLQVDFYIDPNQDIASAKRIVEEALQNTRGADVPKPRVILVNQVLIDRMVTVRLRTRVFVMGAQPEQEIESELTERVLEGFRTSGIRMPAAHPSAA